MPSIQSVLGSNIKALRKQKDWSRNFLADRLDISVSFLTMVELGQRGVSLTLVEDIASVLGVSIPYLFTDHETPPAKEGLDSAQLTELERELQESLSASLAEFFAQKRRK